MVDIPISNKEAAAQLRSTVEAMSDHDLCLLVLVASHALNDTEVTEMIAGELGIFAKDLATWFDTAISPVDDPSVGPWADAQQAISR